METAKILGRSTRPRKDNLSPSNSRRYRKSTPAPRAETSPSAPKIIKITIDPEKKLVQ